VVESVCDLGVEDDQKYRALLKALIEGGFEPAIAPSGEEAVVTLPRKVKPAIGRLLTDVSLRGSDVRWQFAKQAREIDPAFLIIYMTCGRADQMACAWRPQQHPSGSRSLQPQLVTRRFAASIKGRRR